MHKSIWTKNWIWLLLLGIALLLSRGPTLTHEMANHPDEHVFVQGAGSMADKVLGLGEFSESKPYPEGAYFFFLPAQLCVRLLRITATDAGQIANRVASVVYFALGLWGGWLLLAKAFSKRCGTLFVCLLVFSLFHIEQSRYGTGESISLCLLMWMLFCLQNWMLGRRDGWLFLSAALLGFLGAVKYPQLCFAVLPLWAVLAKENAAKRRLVLVGAGVFVVLAAFLLLSPGIVRSYRYVIEVTRRELKAYMLGGNLTEAGGAANHAVSVLVYWLFYADFLLAPVFAFFGLGHAKGTKAGTPRAFWACILPITAGGFALYNLFVSALFMRTLYPFFAIAALYTAIGLDRVLHEGTPKKLSHGICIALLLATLVRSGLYVQALLPRDAADVLDGYIAQAQEITGGGKMVGLTTDKYVAGSKAQFAEKYPNVETISYKTLRQDGFPSPQPGDIVITGSLDCGKASPYPLPPPDKALESFIAQWQEYKAQNAYAYVGQTYPPCYAWLFGFGINGTVSEFDFPMNQVYAFAPITQP